MDGTTTSSTDDAQLARRATQTRRRFLGGVSGLALAASTGMQAQALTLYKPKVGCLFSADHYPKTLFNAFLGEIIHNKWIYDPNNANQNLDMTMAWGDWTLGTARQKARDLITWGAQVILAGDSLAAHAAALETDDIPIVTYINGNLEDAKNGGQRNLGGATNESVIKTGERLRLLKLVMNDNKRPFNRVGLIYMGTNPSSLKQREAAVDWCGTNSINYRDVPASNPEDLKTQLDALSTGDPIQAILVISDPLTSHERWYIAGFAIAKGYPSMFGKPEAVTDACGLLAFAADRENFMREAADVVDVVLRKGGAPDKPWDAAAALEAAAKEVRKAHEYKFLKYAHGGTASLLGVTDLSSYKAHTTFSVCPPPPAGHGYPGVAGFLPTGSGFPIHSHPGSH